MADTRALERVCYGEPEEPDGVPSQRSGGSILTRGPRSSCLSWESRDRALAYEDHAAPAGHLPRGSPVTTGAHPPAGGCVSQGRGGRGAGVGRARRGRAAVGS